MSDEMWETGFKNRVFDGLDDQLVTAFRSLLQDPARFQSLARFDGITAIEVTAN